MTNQRLNPVAWTEGMFLRPQHLQQRDLFSEERLRYHLHTLSPFHWGIRQLEINEDALADHQVEVLQLDAVLPGGLIVKVPGNATLDVREFDPDSQRIGVHVGLRHLSTTEPNGATESDAGRPVRYKIRPTELPDLNVGEDPVPVDLLYPHLRLFVSGEVEELEVHETFKLAEIVATGDIGRPFGLSPSYCPPLLRIQAWPPLSAEIARIVAQLSAKVRVAAGRTSDVGIRDLPQMWIRYTLSRITPVLRHLMSTGETCPFAFYTALVEAAGALSAFNVSEAAELPPYDHENLFVCYRELLAYLDAHLQKTVQTNFTQIPLDYDRTRDSYGTSALTTDLVDPRHLYLIAVKASLDTEVLIQTVEGEGKAGAFSSLRAAIMTNTRGLRIEHLPAAPTEIPALTGYEYFRVDPHHERWSKVKDEFTFGLHIPKVDTADVQLYVVPEGS